jgi:hypothetical protein
LTSRSTTPTSLPDSSGRSEITSSGQFLSLAALLVPTLRQVAAGPDLVVIGHRFDGVEKLPEETPEMPAFDPANPSDRANRAAYA